MILGLDVSTKKTGYCLYNGEVRGSGVITPKAKDVLIKRAKYMRTALYDILEKYNPEFVVIEAPIVRNVKGSISISKVIGILELLLYNKGKQYVFVHNMTLKKWATGKGNASKKKMINKAIKLGFKPIDDNEADAFHLARWGNENREQTRKRQRHSNNKIR